MSTATWRAIRGEVDELTAVPIQVPSLPEAFTDRAFLVITGRLSDPVRDQIASINRLNDGSKAKLEVVQVDDLVELFTVAFDEFLPQSIEKLQEMLRSYVTDGRGPADAQTLAGLFSQILDEAPHRRKTERQRAFSNIIVSAQFVSAPFAKSANHISAIDVWTLAACAIVRRSQSWHCSQRETAPFLDLCKTAIHEFSKSLLDEAISRPNFHEGREPGEFFLYHARRVVVLGYLGAVINSRRIEGEQLREESRELTRLAMREMPFQFWGEGAWNLLINLVLGMRHVQDGVNVGEELVVQWLKYVCPFSLKPVRNPYSSIEEFFRSMVNYDDEEALQTAPISYTARAAFDFLVRRMRRVAVSLHWKTLSRFECAAVIPTNPWMFLEWRITSGVFELTTWPLQGSWSTFREQVARRDADPFLELPTWLLPYFLCVYRHRVNPQFTTDLDRLTT